MKGFYKIFIIVCFFVFSLFSLTSTAQCQPWSPYQSQPINININLSDFSGSYSSGFPGNYSSGFPPPLGMMNNYMGGLYGMGGPYSTGGIYGPSYNRISSSVKADNDKFTFIHSASDGEHIYLPFDEGGGQNRGAIAILEASGSDDYEYLSHVTLGKKKAYDGYGSSTSASKMIVQDDLLVIGAMDKGAVYLVDVSDKAEPELINKLNVGEKYQSGGALSRVTGLAIEGEVLFVSVKFLGSYKHIIFSLDISNPEDTDEDDDVLDYYILDADDCQEIYTMVSTPGYLYITAKYEYDSTILIMDIANPDDLSLVETLDMKGEDQVSVAVNGDYLLAAVEVERGSDGAYKLKVIDISGDPEDHEIISSSKEFSGQTDDYGSENMVIRDNYAYVFLRDTDETKIYVFDISDPEDPDLVETSRGVDGDGLTLYLVNNNRLCLHTTKTMKIFDISDPEDISVDETVDILDILEDELDDWGEERFSITHTDYPNYPLSVYPTYGGYGGSGYSGWGGPTYGGYSSYSSGGYTPPPPWESQFLSTGGGSYAPAPWGSAGSGYSGYGGPTYGGYGGSGPGWGYSGWGNWQ